MSESIGFPSRTIITGRPVLVWYSLRRIDAQRAIERGRHVVGRVRVVRRLQAFLVGRPHHLAAANASAGHQHEHGSRIMVAAVPLRVDLRRAAEFARHQNRGRIRAGPFDLSPLAKAVQAFVQGRQLPLLQLHSSCRSACPSRRTKP